MQAFLISASFAFLDSLHEGKKVLFISLIMSFSVWNTNDKLDDLITVQVSSYYVESSNFSLQSVHDDSTNTTSNHDLDSSNL